MNENLENNTSTTEEESTFSPSNSIDFGDLTDYLEDNIEDYMEDSNDSVDSVTASSINQSVVEDNVDSNASEETIPKDLIPPIKNSLLIKEEVARFKGAEWFNQASLISVSLLGLGGIGSYVAYLLGRLNINRLDMWDMDIVDNSNMSGQFHSKSNVGRSKVASMYTTLVDFCNYFSANTISRRFVYKSDRALYPIVICGFDNMIARKDAFKTWKNSVLEAIKSQNPSTSNNIKPSDFLFIDGRLAAEEFQVFCLQGDDYKAIDKYEEEQLFADDEVEATVCSYKQTAFCANMIGSIIVNCLINFLYNKTETFFERPVPYFTRYNAATMMLKIE